jgi:hypothetical protein
MGDKGPVGYELKLCMNGSGLGSIRLASGNTSSRILIPLIEIVFEK